MPSRKRNQGRARKGKAAVAGSRGTPAMPREEREICTHGYSLDSAQQQVLHTFVDVWARVWEKDGGSLYPDVTDEILRKHPELLQAKNRELIQSYLVFLGTRDLLGEWDGDKHELAGAGKLAKIGTVFLVLLENYDPCRCLVEAEYLDGGGSPDFFNVDCLAKHRDQWQGCERSVVRFFRRRIPCSYLDEMYAEVKPQSKTGLCDHCRQRTEYRAGLKECSSCKCVQYCSVECQVAAWPRHKADCRRWSQKYRTKTTSAVGKEGTSSAPTPTEAGATPAHAGAGSFGYGSTTLTAMEQKDDAASSKK